MKTVFELSEDQLAELKGWYLTQHLMEVEGREPSYGELADASSIVPDEMIYEAYAGTVFSDDDFGC